MERLESLYNLTYQLVEELDKLSDENTDRDIVIHTINNFIEKRELMLKQIKKPYTEKELQFGKKIVHLNEQVKIKMDALYEEIKSDMKQVQKKKTQNYSYLNPYGKMKTTDGMYLDSKL